MARFNVESARKFLYQADVFFYNDIEQELAELKEVYKPEEWPEKEKAWRAEIEASPQTLNMNDVWGWACEDGQRVPNDKLVEVAELFWHYGWAGMLYWASEQNGQMKSEFHDNNRMIEFVRNEERIKAETPESNERAYRKVQYTLGVKDGSTT